MSMRMFYMLHAVVRDFANDKLCALHSSPLRYSPRSPSMREERHEVAPGYSRRSLVPGRDSPWTS